MTKLRKFQEIGFRLVTDKNGYTTKREIYYKKIPKESNFYFADNPKLLEYRKKAFAKPEPQAEEYYEGFDNCVKSAIHLI